MDSTNSDKNWGDHIKIGQYQLTSRVCLAALTRQRCDPATGIPNDLLVQYYTQRAKAGLMLTQASAWSPNGHSFPGAGNMYTKQQAQGWRKVLQSVHQKGGKLFLQIFHGGRATDPKINGGLDVFGPSPVAVRQTIRVLQGQPYQVPKQMTIEDIKRTQQQFRKSVILAKQVGFDGLQLHGAHGYLVDSFLRSQSNKRTDSYGGSAQNRGRFCLELIDIALEYYKPYQIGIKLSPVSRLRDMFDQNPEQTFGYLLKELSKRNIGFVQLRESCEVNMMKSYYTISPAQQIQHVCKTFRPYYNGIIIANDSFDNKNGLDIIRNGWADMVSFGRLYISNPDLTQRILKGEKLNYKWEFNTFYGFHNGVNGYTDYPLYEEWIKTQVKQEGKDQQKL